MTESLVTNKRRSFWDEVKRILRHRKVGCGDIVDGCTDKCSIASKYNDLYTSIPSDNKAGISDIVKEVNSSILLILQRLVLNVM